MSIHTCKCMFRIWLVATGAMIGTVSAQTIELRSSRVSILAGSERERFLAAHNQARADVKVEPVTWSDDVSRYARESLEKQRDNLLAAAMDGWSEKKVPLPTHRAERKYGENVAARMGNADRSAEWAVELWLREKSAFDRLNENADYRVGDEQAKSEEDAQGSTRPVIVGHYTAIVWRNTKQIGAAKLVFELVDDQGAARTYEAVICNYDPQGNQYRERPY